MATTPIFTSDSQRGTRRSKRFGFRGWDETQKQGGNEDGYGNAAKTCSRGRHSAQTKSSRRSWRRTVPGFFQLCCRADGRERGTQRRAELHAQNLHPDIRKEHRRKARSVRRFPCSIGRRGRRDQERRAAPCRAAPKLRKDFGMSQEFDSPADARLGRQEGRRTFDGLRRTAESEFG